MDLRTWKEEGTFLNYKNNAVFNRIGGKEGAKWMLLLHGNPGASYEYSKLIPFLEKEFRIISVDLLGFGFSDKPTSYQYSLSDHAQMLEVLLNITGAKVVNIVATDYSGLIALEFIKQQYDSRKLRGRGIKTTSCTFLNTCLYPGTSIDGLQSKLHRGALGKLITLTVNKNRFVNQFLHNFGNSKNADRDLLNAIWDLSEVNEGFNVRHKLLNFPAEYRKNYRTLIRTAKSEEVPFSLIYGLKDNSLRKRATSEYKNQFPESNLTLLDSIGKYPHIESPKEIARLLSSFIAQELSVEQS